jgi:hypothetical protein
MSILLKKRGVDAAYHNYKELFVEGCFHTLIDGVEEADAAQYII